MAKNINGEIMAEFKGSTKQAILDIHGEIKEIKEEVKSIKKWLLILSMITTVAVIERLPALVSMVVAK